MFGKGIKDGIPIGLGYFSVSFSFGILAVAEGLKWWEAVLISMTNLTSAGQFAGLTVMISSGTFIEMAITQFVINLRYALMSISLSQKVSQRFRGLYRVILGFGITDEIFAVAMNNKKAVTVKYFLGLATIPYFGWALGTMAGAVCGNILPDIVCDALGVALYGMFIAIVLPKVKTDKKIAAVVVVAIIVSVLLYYVPVLSSISSGCAIIIASVTAAGVGAILFPKKNNMDEV
ncbi:MAG: AzlC family ABC transporter permease [Lachnospiraceae bacterium]|nr:AzlC family ABC transporter permease [Lachnospiraceae bacterium]